MGQYINFASGGAITNLDTTYETVGITSVGAGTLVTGGAANTKGAAYTQLSASTASAWSGFWVMITAANSSGNRYLIDIGTGAAAAEVALVPNIFAYPSTAGSGVQALFFPINVAAGTRISARVQSNGGSGSCQIAVMGEVSVAGSRPMYASVELLAAADTANTRPSSVSITSVNSAGTGWTQVVASTARQYGALIPNLGVTGSLPATAQSLSYRLATGAAASEVLFWQTLLSTAAANPYTGRMTNTPIYRTTPISTRVSAEVLVNTAGDTFSPQIYGCY